ncbi:MAG: aminotransferase class I/II-fold pyridoxal phosphate-dependent enzyme [Actinobacteria bacterium]|nr:aminotransferase class I/II-fold pyridoxal phosphate-dependent enzyme [Actinomycetota bacterium]
MIDLRSDTLTRPVPEMLAAMAAAEVGDEQYLEDPTTNELQRRMAELLGHEAALFLPTATMANQAALRAQTKPGGVLLAEERTHILVYEWGGPAIHSGLIMRGVPSEHGRLTPRHVWAENDPDLGPGGVVVLENTHRSSGGRIWPLDEFRATVDAARERGAAVHLDGARLFNASVAAGLPPSAWASLADSVTICFSKGLACPTGAILAGSAELIERAWESKYLFGGALRQSGVIAAAMLWSLDHHVERLAEDHARARRLAEGIGVEAPETNFVSIPDEPGLEERLAERGVLVSNLRPGWLRAVTYLGITDEDVDMAAQRMADVLAVRA